MRRSPSTTLALICGFVPLVGLGCESNQTDQSITTAKSAAARVVNPQVSTSDGATFATDNEAFALAAYHRMGPSPQLASCCRRTVRSSTSFATSPRAPFCSWVA